MRCIALSKCGSFENINKFAYTNEMDSSPNPNVHDKEKKTTLSKMVMKALSILRDEVGKTENKEILSQHIINPILQLIYNEVYPYIAFLLGTLIFILLISLLVLIMLIIFYVQSKMRPVHANSA